MNGRGKADSSKVPAKSPDKAGAPGQILVRGVEGGGTRVGAVEGTGLAMGNAPRRNALRRPYPRREPDAVAPLVRIRKGGHERSWSLPRLNSLLASL